MIKDKYKTSLSKTLSYILRHHPEDFDLEMEIDGTISVNNLIKALQEDDRFENIKFEDIEKLADNDEKNRFTIIDIENEEKRIKANYGHSIEQININYEKIIPSHYLYHGTTYEYYKKIKKDGIKKMGRNYVHLSKTINQARKVGKRRSDQPVILEIDALKMHQDGHSFFKTNSDIILTEYVDTKYIEVLD